MIKSRLCDYSDAYMLVSGIISVEDTSAEGAAANNTNKNVMFKNCGPFTNCISEINNTQVDNGKENDIVMPMYNLIEYGYNYLDTSGSLSQYHEPSFNPGDNATVDFTGANHNSKSFKFKQKIIGAAGNNTAKNVEVMVPLKYIYNFWRTLEMPEINFKINHILTWSKNCIIASYTAANKETTFAIRDSKLYVPVVTLSAQDNAKQLEQLKSGFKRTIYWNKYQPKVSLQAPKFQIT